MMLRAEGGAMMSHVMHLVFCAAVASFDKGVVHFDSQDVLDCL
jgi:hypothetical protein